MENKIKQLEETIEHLREELHQYKDVNLVISELERICYTHEERGIIQRLMVQSQYSAGLIEDNSVSIGKCRIKIRFRAEDAKIRYFSERLEVVCKLRRSELIDLYDCQREILNMAADIDENGKTYKE